ncbi:transcription factor IBH1-like 1 isoform X2 [Ricinus communis]|uniref:transcription factor IBH1-like 1 isoform X2 n=1 Tax=Ricinus communis TaxID=3988 RepID=UPI00201A66C4|nr:transcription factor IBH1-like 1 isoform X2 [Ricinus communis]
MRFYKTKIKERKKLIFISSRVLHIWWAIHTMCLHVPCLSLKGPPLAFLRANKWDFPPHSSPSQFPLPLQKKKKKKNFILGFLYILSWICHSPATLSHTLISHDFLLLITTRYLSKRMRPPQSLKHEFLKKWVLGLKICNSTRQNMTILERKKAIKLSADIAMASTRSGLTCWSRALVAKASRDADNKVIVERILASESERVMQVSPSGIITGSKRVRSKKILKKSRFLKRIRRCVPQMVIAKSLAKRMVKKRTQVLKSLVPGGEFMDDSSLIEETLDYLVSLRAQVDVMRTLAKAAELLNDGVDIYKDHNNPWPNCTRAHTPPAALGIFI